MTCQSGIIHLIEDIWSELDWYYQLEVWAGKVPVSDFQAFPQIPVVPCGWCLTNDWPIRPRPLLFHLRTGEISGSSSCNWCSLGLLYRTGQKSPVWFVGDPLLSLMTPGESSLCAAAPVGKLLSNRMKVKARVRNFHMDDSTDHMEQSGCLWSDLSQRKVHLN